MAMYLTTSTTVICMQ